MKKLLFPILVAATIFASCESGDPRIAKFENKELGAYVVKQEKFFNDMLSAIDANDSAKVKALNKEMENNSPENEKLIEKATPADMKLAEEILQPVITKYFEKMMPQIDINKMQEEAGLPPADQNVAPSTENSTPAPTK